LGEEKKRPIPEPLTGLIFGTQLLLGGNLHCGRWRDDSRRGKRKPPRGPKRC